MNIFAANRISRLPYFLWMLAICVAVSLIQVFAGSHLSRDETSPVMSLVWMLAVGVAAFPIVKRLHDLNIPGWCFLFGLIPIVNVFVGIYLLFGKGTNGTNDYGKPPENLLRKIQTPSFFIASCSDDDAFYREAYEELENSQVDKTLWAKAFAQCNGNENQAKALYIKSRVLQMRASCRGLENPISEMAVEAVEQKTIAYSEVVKAPVSEETEQKSAPYPPLTIPILVFLVVALILGLILGN